MKEKGFTLIELLIVVAIIGIIAAIAIPSLLNALDRARQTTTVENISRLGQGVEQYEMDYQIAPPADDVQALQDIFEETEINLNRAMTRDGWGYDLLYEHSGVRLYTVQSLGSDNAAGPAVTPDANGELIVKHFDEDIIWSMGRFIQRPEGAQTSGENQ